MKWILIIKAVLELLPALTKAIKEVEEILPGKGNGEAKLELIRLGVESAYETGKSVAGVAEESFVAFEPMWRSLKNTIGSIVELFNKAGIFTK